MHSKIFFILIFLIFLGFSICSSYDWDSTNSAKNVRTFAKFMDELYKSYRDNNARFDSIVSGCEMYRYSEKQKRIIFNFTFVKCAAEIADFRVINQNENSKDAYLNLKIFPQSIHTKVNAFLLHYDQTLGLQIGEKFKTEFFSKEKQINKIVMNQIMQLAFSFSARVILCFKYFGEHHSIEKWQLNTLLSAHKILSAQNNGEKNEENGVFPFQIIQIDENGQHLWAQFLSPNQILLDDNSEQQKYIQNFKFILELSKFTLTFEGIYKVLEIIMGKTNNSTEIYEFIKAKFTSVLSEPIPSSSSSSSSLSWLPKIAKKKPSKTNCALIHFGQKLGENLPIGFEEFHKFVRKNEGHCMSVLYYKFGYIRIRDNNTPEEGSSQLELELFSEPLWNYVMAIGITSDGFEDVIQSCTDLEEIVNSVLNDSVQNENTIVHLTELNQFKILKRNIELGERYINGPYEINYKKLNAFVEKIKKVKLLDKKGRLLKDELLPMLDQIKSDYRSAIEYEFSTRLNLRNEGSAIRKFGQILYGTLKKHSNHVKYDETKQLLTFPLSMGKHIIERLSEFIMRNITNETNVKNEIDFVETIQSVVSKENDLLLAEKRQVILFRDENLALLNMLLSFAFRLLIQINELIYQNVPTFLFALGKFDYSYSFNVYWYKYKMNIKKEMVQLNTPNWHLPYYVYLENTEELIDNAKKATQKYQSNNQKRNDKYEDIIDKFLRKLSKSPTIYEVVKLAKMLYEMEENDQILLSPADPKILHFIYKYWDHKNNAKSELSVKNQFCIIARFVMGLLEKAHEEEYLPDIDFVGKFIEQTVEKCTDERLNEEVYKNFIEKIMKGKVKYIRKNIKEIEQNIVNYQEKIMNFGEGVNLNPKLQKEIQKFILPSLIAECKDQYYTKLSYGKMIEWKLLEMALGKIGKQELWKEIEKIHNEWKTEFEENCFVNKNEENLDNVMEKMKKMKEKLEELEDEI